MDDKEYYEILYDAMWDLEEKGKTDIRCPKCGNQIAIKQVEEGTVVYCKTDGCLTAERRGV